MNGKQAARLAAKKIEELVRCKDCRYGEERDGEYVCYEPEHMYHQHDPNWFCATAERKESTDGEE